MRDNKKRKTIVYIDGQNFLYKVADRLISCGLISEKQQLTAIDIPYLVGVVVLEENVEIRYYGVSRIPIQEKYDMYIKQKSIVFADNLRKIRNCLRETGVEYRAVGVLKVRDSDECRKCHTQGYKFQEKGVDVGMAVDIVQDAMSKNAGHIVLLSSDTDLMPAIKIARRNKIEITYVAFDNQITQSLSRQSNSTQVLRDHEIVEAYKRMNKIS